MCDEKPNITCCGIQSINRFLGDIEAPYPLCVEFKLVEVIASYNENAPTNSLTTIADNFYNCAQPTVGQSAIITAEELGKIIVYLIILTVIFVLLVVIILGLLDKTRQPWVTIAIILFFALIYVTVGWLLIYNTWTIISNEINNIDINLNNCVHNALTELDIYTNAQQSAINNALCDYPLNGRFCP